MRSLLDVKSIFLGSSLRGMISGWTIVEGLFVAGNELTFSASWWFRCILKAKYTRIVVEKNNVQTIVSSGQDLCFLTYYSLSKNYSSFEFRKSGWPLRKLLASISFPPSSWICLSIK